jgi:hypothetical protein
MTFFDLILAFTNPPLIGLGLIFYAYLRYSPRWWVVSPEEIANFLEFGVVAIWVVTIGIYYPWHSFSGGERSFLSELTREPPTIGIMIDYLGCLLTSIFGSFGVWMQSVRDRDSEKFVGLVFLPPRALPTNTMDSGSGIGIAIAMIISIIGILSWYAHSTSYDYRTLSNHGAPMNPNVASGAVMVSIVALWLRRLIDFRSKSPLEYACRMYLSSLCMIFAYF